MLSQYQLRAILSYDPVSGSFTWLEREPTSERVRSWNSRYAGKRAEHDGPHGYQQINISKRSYYAHRLAFLYMTGAFPQKDVDHKNLNKADNRWENLREATKSQNQWNRAPNRKNKCGLKGVYLYHNGRFKAQASIGGKNRHIGYFDTAEEAHSAYRQAVAEHRGEFARSA